MKVSFQILCSLVFIFLTNLASAQNFPVCTDFEEIEPGTTGGWIGTAVNDFGVVSDATTGNQFLTASDASGGSSVQGPAPLAGDWNKLLAQGFCLDLCWDVKLLDDGAPTSVASGPTSITIISGSGQRATFNTSTNISDTDSAGNPTDWYTFCAPIKELDSNGDLPSNAQGSWSLAPGEPNSTWTDILSDVKEVYFKVDFLGSSNISEKWQWDNICLVESEECGCMKISDPILVNCKQLPNGTWIFNYNFYITNLSGFETSQVTLTGPATFIPGGNQTLPLVIPNGQTTANPITVSVQGQPGEVTCFGLALLAPSQNGGTPIVCCKDEICLNLPCLKIQRKEIECVPGPLGTQTYDITMAIQNISNAPITNIYFFDETGGNVTFNPDHIPTPTNSLFIPPGGVATVTTNATVTGGINPIIFRVTVHDDTFDFCCDLICELELPDCCECVKEWDFSNYTADEIDDIADTINLELTADGKLALPQTGGPKTLPSVWMACSDRGTIVRIDTDSKTILGEYRTWPINPQTFNSNPSRTTVDQFGECWVGNRNNLVDVLSDRPGSVARIGWVDGGIRYRKEPSGTFVLDPLGEYIANGTWNNISPSVTDRNGDGYIRTSIGLGNVLEWDPSATGGDNLGGVSLADDECITHFVRTHSSRTRALAIDKDNNLWVGGNFNNKYSKVDGSTGTMIMNPGTFGGEYNIAGGYGALVDGNNNLWSVSGNWALVRKELDNISQPQDIIYFRGYGIAIDVCKNEIYSSTAVGNETIRMNSDGTVWQHPLNGPLNTPTYTIPSSTNTFIHGQYQQVNVAQGLCFDDNGIAWLGQQGGLLKINSADYLGQIPANTATQITPPATSWSGAPRFTGTAVDNNGKIWASARNENAAGVYDPLTGAWDKISLGTASTHPSGIQSSPYNYSDMTGRSALTAGGQNGFAVFTHDSGCDDTEWGRVSWVAELTGTPNSGCRVKAEVRAANDTANFPSTWTTVDSSENFCNSGISGRYIQLRITLYRPNGCPPACNIRLCSVVVECCNAVGNMAPKIENIDPILIVEAGDKERVNLRTTIEDEDGNSLIYQWYVNGNIVSVGSSPKKSSAILSHDFPNGKNLVELMVTDGKDTSKTTTTVEIGDHTPPQIILPESQVIAAFMTSVPDITSKIEVTDNNVFQNKSDITITQDPKPGTAVTEKLTLISITATDSAGNQSSTETIIRLDPVISISSPKKYSTFEYGEPINIKLDSNIAELQTVKWEIWANGKIVREGDGSFTTTTIDNLPEGIQTIEARVFDSAGNSSTSKGILVYIVPREDADGLMPRLRLGKMNIEETKIPLSFMAPVGFQCCVQFSENLENWKTLHTIQGEDADVEIDVEIVPGSSTGFYRLLLIEGQEEDK